MIRLEIERLERIEYSFYRCISPLLKLFLDPRSRLHDTREEHDNIVECICISNLSRRPPLCVTPRGEWIM